MSAHGHTLHLPPPEKLAPGRHAFATLFLVLMGTVLSFGAVTTYEQAQIQKMERAVASASLHSPLRANYRLAQSLSFHGGIDMPDVEPITSRDRKFFELQDTTSAIRDDLRNER
jgi:hypothetical protein